MVGCVAVSAAANGTILPSVSPNALVAIRAAAVRITGLRISFRELWSDVIEETSLLKINPLIATHLSLLINALRGNKA